MPSVTDVAHLGKSARYTFVVLVEFRQDSLQDVILNDQPEAHGLERIHLRTHCPILICELHIIRSETNELSLDELCDCGRPGHWICH